MILEKQGEHGEIKRGYLSDAGEQIQLATYSKSIGITRQAIIKVWMADRLEKRAAS